MDGGDRADLLETEHHDESEMVYKLFSFIVNRSSFLKSQDRSLNISAREKRSRRSYENGRSTFASLEL